MPRPKKEINLAKVESLAAQGLTEEQIALSLGIAEQTFRNRKKDTWGLLGAIKKGRAKGVATISNALFSKAKGGDLGAMVFYLKNRDPENWKDKVQQEHSGPDGGPMEHKTVVVDERSVKDAIAKLQSEY